MRNLTLLFLVVAAPVCANPAMEGEWMLDVRPEGAPLTGLLQLPFEQAELAVLPHNLQHRPMAGLLSASTVW